MEDTIRDRGSDVVRERTAELAQLYVPSKKCLLRRIWLLQLKGYPDRFQRKVQQVHRQYEQEIEDTRANMFVMQQSI